MVEYSFLYALRRLHDIGLKVVPFNNQYVVEPIEIGKEIEFISKIKPTLCSNNSEVIKLAKSF